jgi:hypothetical protein
MDHIGLVVEDLREAMEVLHELQGLHWAEPVVLKGHFNFKDGVMPWESEITYSIEGPLHFELIEQHDVRGWETLTDGRLAHHIAFVTDSLESDAAWMTARGLGLEVHGLSEDGAMNGFAYHRSPAPGVLFELLSSDLKADLDRWTRDGIPLTS